MTEVFRSPMLAKEYDADKLVFPLQASPKVDGIRCVVDKFNGVIGAYSRSGKLIPNKYVQLVLARQCYIGLDGELTIGSINAPDVYNRTQGVMKIDGSPDFQFNVFDHRLICHATYERRRSYAEQVVADAREERIVMLDQTCIESMEEFDYMEETFTEDGFEGMMVRQNDPAYKFGRSSPKHGGLLKVKRFAHAEATIIGFKELMHNGNVAEVNELGRTKRSSAKEGLIGGAMMGAYICESPDYVGPFDISCGSMDWATRAAAWVNRENDRGRLTRFKHLPHGAKDKPRHGLFDGFRDPIDMS